MVELAPCDHRTADVLVKFVPMMLISVSGLPAGAVLGLIVLIVSVPVIVKGDEFEIAAAPSETFPTMT